MLLHFLKNKLRVSILLVVLICAEKTQAQQQQLLSQYHLNDFVFNPAVAGTKGYTSFQSAFRKQWLGLEDAPETIMAYLQAPLKLSAGNIGLGAMFYTDKAAAIKRTGASATYAQNWLVNDEVSFSLGLSGNVEQYSIDMAKLVGSLDAGDPLLNSAANGKMALDAGFSAYVYGRKWSAGAYANNLMESKLEFYKNSLAKLYRHYYFMAQIELSLDENGDFTLLPALLVTATRQTLAQLNINANLIHQNNKWVGLSYRTNQTHALSANLGLMISDKILAGYAYDMVAGKLNQFNAGRNSSHEFTLGFRFSKNTNPGMQQVRCPLL